MNNAQHKKFTARTEATEKNVDTLRTPVKKATTQREVYGSRWLRVLRTLPDALYKQTVRRFAYGETAKEVAIFIVAQEDRGGCQGLSFNTLRQYLQLLRAKVRETDKDNRKARRDSIHKKAKEIRREELRLANVVSIDQAAEAVKNNTPISPDAMRPVVREVREIEIELKAICAGLSAREAIFYTYFMAKCRFEAGLELELKAGVPMEVNTSISRVMVQCVGALIKCDKAEFAERVRQAKKRRKELRSLS